MPIASRKPVAELPTQPSLPQSQPSSYKSIVYDDKNVPLHSLIAYVQGSAWSVDYYGGVVSEHNDLREVDPGQVSVYQQYQKTLGLELRVTTALNTSYDSGTGITRVTGTAIIYPFMVPNVDDYFVTDVADNQKAIFRIYEVNRNTFNRDSVYSVEYDLVGYVSQQQAIYDDLEAKVIRTYHFSKDRLMEGLSPTLKDEEYNQVINLKQCYRELVQYYFKTFFDRRFMTLVIPGQDHALYDPHLVNYLMKIVDTFDAYEIRNVKLIPTDNDRYLSQTQFWDLLLNKDYPGRKSCNDVMGLVSKELFNKNTFIQGLAFSNINYVVYPDNADTSTLIEGLDDVKLLATEEILETTGYKGSILNVIDNQFVTDTKTYALIPQVLQDDKYVLTQAFYDDEPTQTVLEIQVKDYMRQKTLNLDMIYGLFNAYRKWNRLEQFYYLPILMTLIKEADRAQYS